ncbi:hypothetical protein TNCV_3058271 [Trichonephila clavipes]|nr:hypothetical protein TNCV_3058271 [Trichonephila clavipes]
MEYWFPDDDGIYQDDNAFPHHAKIVQTWFNHYHGVFHHLKWPSKSPDLNGNSVGGTGKISKNTERAQKTSVGVGAPFGKQREMDCQGLRFVEWAQNEIAVVPDFHKRILFSDEAHFWLNGYVNKQNCRIWSEANPQVYVETPLHPEKLTVWCALWVGGILLQKR